MPWYEQVLAGAMLVGMSGIWAFVGYEWCQSKHPRGGGGGGVSQPEPSPPGRTIIVDGRIPERVR